LGIGSLDFESREAATESLLPGSRRLPLIAVAPSGLAPLTQGSQSLALGLILSAATQLVAAALPN